MIKLSTTDYKEEVLRCINLLDKGSPMVVFDLETTGLSPTMDRILSFSALKLIKEGDLFKEIDRINIFINPGFKIPERVTEINGITDELVKNAPRESQAIKDIIKFFGKEPIVAGYNSINFDAKFMDAMYLRSWGDNFKPMFHLDVFQMAKEKLSINKHNLQSVAHELGADIGLTFHRSMDDVIATARVFQTLYTEYVYESNRISKLRRPEVISITWWNKSHMLNRLYVKTEPYENIYFDLYKKEWVSDNNDIDLRGFREDVLKKYGVKDEVELKEKIGAR